MRVLIEWREMKTSKGMDYYGYDEDGHVAQIGDIAKKEWMLDLLGQVSYHPTLEAAKAKAESLYRNHLITAIKAADDDLLKEAGYMPIPDDLGELRDEYHSINELYEFRKMYNAALFNEWAESGKYNVHKSTKHHDGEDCFGGGWFIVVAVLPGGQITNHYKMADWDLFRLPMEGKALFEYDGHTGADVLERLKGI
jgi:hypothetical protein